ncbi:MAG: DUF4032 domain-containing protein [Actinomycetota bacterium]|nr:DUF4032 domain-containing protein [Actinomycetota bacterium]
MALRIVAARPSRDLLQLPWQVRLEDWDQSVLVPLARGISRHVVRFVRADGQVYAIKETREEWAWREYHLLRNLRRLGLPAVAPFGVVTGRQETGGEPIEPVLITRHLPRSLPYRALFSQRLRPDTVGRVVDALVVLLVRLHVAGFWWGDCSLSNTLFRRSAGQFAAYLVDAETGELHETLSDGQRAHDLDVVTTNIFGELSDLLAGELLDQDLDPFAMVERVQRRYLDLWEALTGVEEFDTAEMWRIQRRVKTLNELGFDIDELDIVTDFDGATVRIRPCVVEAGHHTRRLHALTGIDVEEEQARRLLNDLDAFAAAAELQSEDPTIVGHRWLAEVYEPLRAMVPADLRDNLGTAELFHEMLEHRWYLSERAGREVDFFETARDYLANVLPTAADRS